LAADFGEPVQHYCGIGANGEFAAFELEGYEVLAIRRGVEGSVGCAHLDLGFKENFGDARLKGVALHGIRDGKNRGVVKEKKFMAVFGPAGLGAAIGGDLPFAARAGERDYVNL